MTQYEATEADLTLKKATDIGHSHSSQSADEH